LFLVAHFHNQVIGGVVFGYMAGFYYWFPKVFGFKLNERLGKYAAKTWLIGFFVTFIPIYILGFMGVTRRLDHYAENPSWQALFILSGVGLGIICLGVGFQVLQMLIGIRDYKKNLDKTGDPWNGRTLEWSTTSPAPHYNFAILPTVTTRDQFWYNKQDKLKPKKPIYEDIEMPRSSGDGFLIAGFAFLFGFGAVWHIWWLVFISLLAIIFLIIRRSMNDDTEILITAQEVAALEAGRREANA
jgi:cytochrome o ubiquinol oxidase subunit 1